MFEGMLGFNGFLAENVRYELMFFSFLGEAVGGGEKRWIEIAVIFGLVFVWLRWLPNTQQIMRNFSPALGKVAAGPGGLLSRLAWRPSAAWGLAFGVLTLIILMLLSDAQVFIYFRF